MFALRYFFDINSMLTKYYLILISRNVWIGFCKMLDRFINISSFVQFSQVSRKTIVD
jgi:hypothetical protein